VYIETDGSFDIDVGYPTNTLAHWWDAGWYEVGGYAGNGENAEAYLGYTVSDAIADAGKKEYCK